MPFKSRLLHVALRILRTTAPGFCAVLGAFSFVLAGFTEGTAPHDVATFIMFLAAGVFSNLGAVALVVF